MSKFPSHRQSDMSTCGPTCLQNILEFWGYKVSASEIIRYSKTDKRGNSLYALIKTAEKYKMVAEPFSDGSIDDLTSSLPLPAIAHIIAEQTVEHYVVIYKITDQYVYLSDPSAGLRKQSKDDFCREWTGHILCVHKGEGFKKKKHMVPPLIYFFSPLWKNKKKLAVIVLLSILVMLLGTSTSYYYQILTNDLVIHRSAQQLFKFTWLTIGLLTIRGVFSYFRQSLLNYVSIYIDTSITLDTVRKILSLPLPTIRAKSIGDWQSRIYEISSLSGTICSAMFSLILDSGMAFFGIYLLLRQSVSLFIIAAVSALVFVFITTRMNKKLQSSAEHIIQSSNRENAYVTEVLNGIPSIKANVMERNCNRHLKTLRAALNDEKAKYSRLDNIRDSLLEGLFSILEIVLLGYGAYEIIRGNISLGTLLAFTTLTSYFFEPLLKLTNMSAQMKEASISAQRLLDVQQEPEESDPPDATPFVSGDIVLKDIEYAYGYREPIISHVSFSVVPHQITALIGANGCGKSTVAQLICGLYTPTAGDIQYGGLSFSQFSKHEIRRHVVYIPQETFLFQASIRENLQGAAPVFTDAELMAVCEQVCLSEKIAQMRLGLDTVLNENGYDLSGGERQRIAFARALLQHPKCIILDESTSAMDKLARDAIGKLLQKLKIDTTIIIITHQKDVLAWCDRAVFFCKDGSILTDSLSNIQKSEEFSALFAG